MVTLFTLIGARCFVLFVYLIALLPPHQPAKEPIVVDRDLARYGGQEITFSLTARSSSKINRIHLIHGVKSNTCLGSSQARREAEFKAGTHIEATWTWDLARSGNLPPGASVWWQWELEDESGSVLISEPQTLAIEDPNLSWQKIETATLDLYWSQGDRQFGVEMFRIADKSLKQLTRAAGLDHPEPVRMMIYPSTAAVRDVLVNSSEWMGGVAFPEYNVVMIGIAPDESSWAARAIPHELSHLITGKRIYNCSTTDMPTWLNEGLAEYATGPTIESDRSGVLAALKAGNLPALTSLSNGFAVDGAIAARSYDQSHMVVEFIIDSYGADSITELLSYIQSGEQIDEALLLVFGLDTASLDQAWRASLGIGTAPQISSLTPSPSGQQTVIPTLALFSPLSSPTLPSIPPTETTTPSPAADMPTATAPTLSATAPPMPATRPASSSLLLIGLGASVAVVAAAVAILSRRRP